jgi:2-methylcitrate dehydratase PrpD
MALAEWAASATFADLPESAVAAMKLLTRTVLGTAVAGATSHGCEATVEQVKEWGGRPEATIWIYGGKAPAHAAAMANSVMARALDICDAAVPGQHIGTSAVPVAVATAELVGGVSGSELITALAIGSEIATRLGFVSRLDGFDPTGACSIFASCVTAAKILRLDARQMLNAMALVFNKAGGSFQSNVDASLAVRVIEGFISQDGVICAQLAQRNITGPKNWLEGVWGYYHLFCKGERDTEMVAGELGKRWMLHTFGYKTRPQCGATISSTDAILALLEKQPFEPEQVERIDIRMASEGPCSLVGSEFELGDHPQVSGQFNVRYCVANAITRKSSKLHHFTDESVSDPGIGALARRIETHLAPELSEGRRELAARVALEVRLKDGRILTCGADGPSGFPPNPKTPQMHLDDFLEHTAYGGRPLTKHNVARILSTIERLDAVADVRELAPLMISEVGNRSQGVRSVG